MLDLSPEAKTALRILALLASVPLILQAAPPRPACAMQAPAPAFLAR